MPNRDIACKEKNMPCTIRYRKNKWDISQWLIAPILSHCYVCSIHRQQGGKMEKGGPVLKMNHPRMYKYNHKHIPELNDSERKKLSP